MNITVEGVLTGTVISLVSCVVSCVIYHYFAITRDKNARFSAASADYHKTMTRLKSQLGEINNFDREQQKLLELVGKIKVATEEFKYFLPLQEAEKIQTGLDQFIDIADKLPTVHRPENIMYVEDECNTPQIVTSKFHDQINLLISYASKK